MSVHTEVEITCDGGGFAYACTEPSIFAHTAARARRELRDRGWLVGRPGGKDYCPAHRSEAESGLTSGDTPT